MVLNDSDDVVDLLILHPRNPKHLKICPHDFFIVQNAGPQNARPEACPCLAYPFRRPGSAVSLRTSLCYNSDWTAKCII